MTLCPCGSGKTFAACCESYLTGTAHAPTAEALMRSRYTAYTRNNMDYLLRTWDRETRPAALEEETELAWAGLTILSTQAGQPGDTAGSVEFIARYRFDGADRQIHETSRFRQHDGEWFYLDGKVDDTPLQCRSEKTGRNDPCPCGSSKKFKKCCGA